MMLYLTPNHIIVWSHARWKRQTVLYFP